VHRTQDNLEAFVNRGGPVRVAFFGGWTLFNESKTRVARPDRES
jgi:hypothetical protein